MHILNFRDQISAIDSLGMKMTLNKYKGDQKKK